MSELSTNRTTEVRIVEKKAKGLRFTAILTLIFVVARLLDIIDWSWWLVFLPIYIVPVIIIGLILAFLAGCLIFLLLWLMYFSICQLIGKGKYKRRRYRYREDFVDLTESESVPVKLWKFIKGLPFLRKLFGG